MASQFHDVLRDFALEKMKEMEDHESPIGEDNMSRVESPGYKGEKEDTEKSEPQTSFKVKKEEKHSKDRHHRHSKKDGHRHRSKRREKKSSSSSRHKKKSKKKASSHHRSRHHKRKDRGQIGNIKTEIIEEAVKLGGDDGASVAKDDAGSEDTDAVIPGNSDDGTSSSDESEPGSVSPPLQLGEDFLVGILQETDRGSEATDDSKDVIDVESDDKTALQEILAERKAKKKAGLDLLSKTREMIIRRCGLEEKKPDNVGDFSRGSASKESVEGTVAASNCRVKTEREEFAEAPKKLSLVKLEAASEASSQQRLLQGQLQKRDNTHVTLPDEMWANLALKKGSPRTLKTEETLKAEPTTSVGGEPLSEVTPHCVSSPPTGSDAASKVDRGKPPVETETNTVYTLTSVNKQNNSNNTDSIAKESVSSENGVGIQQQDSVERNDIPGTVETDNGNKTDKRAQGKAKIIQIKIRTLELPADPKKASEDHAEKMDDASDEDEDEGGDDGLKSDRPWRIVPEEGELTPSTDGDEGHEMLEKALDIIVKQEAGIDLKESTDGSHKHRKSKKRKKDDREEGEISDKKKKRRRHKDNDTGYKSMEKDDTQDSRSKSSDQKKIKSSVIKADSSRVSSHRSRSRSRNRSKSKSPGYRRSRSPGQHRRSRSPGNQRSTSPSYRRSRSRSPNRRGGFDLRDKLSRRRRGRSRSRSRDRNRRERSYTPVEQIDKKKLLEIAKANAYLYQKVASGELPANTPFPQIDSRIGGGRTVHELTEVCKNLSKKGDEESSDEEPVNMPVNSDDEGGLIRHPFQVKERPLSITMNIQNAIPMPIQTSKEKLRVQFPVSSGTKHREKADTLPEGPFGSWEPVKKPEPPTGPPTPKAVAASAAPGAAGTTATTPAVGTPSVPLAGPARSVLPVAPPVPPAPVPEEHKVFEENPREENVNIADVIAMRLKAARQLQTNPLDMEALTSMHKAQSRLRNWVNKDQKPGLFTGKTDATMLTPAELANPNPKNQAWAKKDMFHNHLPVRGGIGMQLLQKMGWKQGEGLGKYKEGSTLPLLLDIKMDRKGLAVKSEAPRRLRFNAMPNRNPRMPKPQPQATTMDLTGKHPVSALNELCSKRKWPQPEYVILRDVGPAHKKEFIFKVVFNGEEFTGAMACNNKKEAKYLAAQTALIKLGLIPNTSA